MDALYQRLKDAKLRLTEQRKALLTALSEAGRPLSADELLAVGSTKDFDLVTVYRNMAAFAEAGLVQTLVLESGKQLFELREPHDHHHHILCRRCHQVVRLDLCFGQELEKLARQHGFSDLTHTIEVFGVCATCQTTAAA